MLMKKITSTDDFLEWANQVNRETGFLCDLQNIYAKSEMELLKNIFFNMAKNDKHIIIFAVQKCMGSENFIDFIRSYIHKEGEHWIDIEIKKINKEWNNIINEKQANEKKNNDYINKINVISISNDSLKERLECQKNVISSLREENDKAKEEIEQLKRELEKQHAFESHIKALLRS